MYKEVFKFNSRPFTSAPYVKHYFASESMHQTLTQARNCIDRSAGPVVVVGGPGSGKSLLLGMLEEQYKSKYSVANLSCTRLGTREDLLRSILFTLDQPHQNMSEGDLRFALIEYLKPSDRCPNGVLLLVDDAETLDFGLLDEFRLITNFVREGQARVRLVLAGKQALEDNLANPKLQSLNQRIAARCYLTPMRRAETASYIQEHISRVGGEAELFDSESLKTAHEVADGCPRLVNQVCEHALIAAATQGASQVTESHVRQAWNDVQGIPGDWSAPANSVQDTSELEKDEGWTVIEFGQLDDEETDNAGTVYDFENSEGEASSVETALQQPAQPAVPQNTEQPEGELEPEPQREPEPEPIDQIAEPEQVDAEDPEPASQRNSEPASETEPEIEPEPEPQPEPQTEPTVEEIAAANGVQLRQPVETVDPFDEAFAEEEQLLDRFAPVVAHQNHASLNVTSQDLEAIRPLSDPSPVQHTRQTLQVQPTPPSAAPAQTPTVQVIGASEATVADPQAPSTSQQLAAQAPESQAPAQQIAVEQTPAQPPVQEAPFQKAAAPAPGVSQQIAAQQLAAVTNLSAPVEQVVTAPETTPPAPELASDRDSISENAEQIEKEAEAILERLRNSTVSHETEAPSPPITGKSIEDLEAKGKEFELDESQKVLEEILKQKSLLASSREQSTSPSEADGDSPGLQSQSAEQPQSINIENPVVQPDASNQPRTDDSEMLIVSRMEQKMESPKSREPDPIPFPETPISKGRAQRMDYQQLFDQLRDISKEQT